MGGQDLGTSTLALNARPANQGLEFSPGYIIILVQLNPHPVTTHRAQMEEYLVHLVVASKARRME